MIPQEQVDLADALQSEFPDLDRDQALMRAHAVLKKFKAKGWKVVELVG